MTTNAYAAKRAILDRLTELARTGPLSTLGVHGGPLQIKYDNRLRDMETRCIYGGGVRFDRPSEQTIADGRRELAGETAVTTWFIRVADDVDIDIADLDEIAETIGEALGDVLATEPGIAGGRSRSRISAGQGDYSFDDDDNVALLMYEVHTESWIE